MSRTNTWRAITLAALVLLVVVFLLPSAKFYRLSEEEKGQMDPAAVERLRSRAIRLGLDLRGGMHLVLEVDKSKLTKDEAQDAVERVKETIRNRIDEFGVAEPVIQRQGADRIVVQLPGVDAERAKLLVKRTAYLEFRLVEDADKVPGVLQRLDRAAPEDLRATSRDTSLASLLEEVAEEDTATFRPEGRPISSRLVVDPRSGFCWSRIEDVATLRSIIEHSAVQAAEDAAEVDLLWGEEFVASDGREYRYLYPLKQSPKLSGSVLSNATLGVDPDDSTPAVDFFLNRRGSRKFGDLTGANIDKYLSIVLDNVVQSAPLVQSRITGRGQITGPFNDSYARDLAIVLRTGALKAPVTIIEERSVGPSLGLDSIRSGVRAALVGMALVVVFMLIYYRLSGLLAVSGLTLCLLLTLAALAALGATLTLPGIAGLILTIGMAVDANVLVFERIREELSRGKTVRSSVQAGYSRALLTILDANITTLITAVILYQFGTGPIKGFAVTLSIGILASMYAALVFSRLIYEFVLRRVTVRRLSI
jgi:protein-export membrane protein SecD